MGNLIRVPEEEWDKIKKDIKALKDKEQVEDQQSHRRASLLLENLTQKEKDVFDFVCRENENRQYNSKQKIVDNFKGTYSREVIFETIENLATYGMVNDLPHPENRQMRNIVPNKDSLLYSTIEDLDKFHDPFESLCKRAVELADKVEPGHNVYYALMTMPYYLYYTLLKMYSVRASMVWPSTKDSLILKKLILMTFSRLIKYRGHLPSIHIENGTDNYVNDGLLVHLLNGTEPMKAFYENAKELNLEKEANAVLDVIWDINKPIRTWAYPEPIIFGWDFDYKDDDWRKLLDLSEKNSDQNIKNPKYRKRVDDAIIDKKLSMN